MIRIGKLRKTGLIILLALSYGFLSYNFFGGWWNSSLGTVCILFFSYLLWGKEFLRQTGLELNTRQVLTSLLLAMVVLAGSIVIMNILAGKNEVGIIRTNWRNYYHIAFYTLNEEIVIGAMILFYMTRRLKIGPLPSVVGLAVIFAVIHFVFYRWIFNDRGIIHILTLATLFCIGFVRNSLILYTGHIGYSWALHFGWMAVMFGSNHIVTATSLRLTEPDRFNLYLGSTLMFFISGLMFIFALVFLLRGSRSQELTGD